MPQTLIMWVALWSETSHRPAARASSPEYFADAGAGQPENVDLVANAIVTLARGLAEASGGTWDDPVDANYYLELALTIARPKTSLPKRADATG